jgi:hypothetical protein
MEILAIWQEKMKEIKLGKDESLKVITPAGEIEFIALEDIEGHCIKISGGSCEVIEELSNRVIVTTVNDPEAQSVDDCNVSDPVDLFL